ncbi:choice-of-anchor Q domain-containing protein [Parabacteroides sp. PF5-6]|uniref:choice-of-anchor Q domain-containing protein n=1 Tax=Parabacteroides sp. PF5-6 TaxID=1742403 RepID=UPI002404999D|nr:choice-of-anchor Q domain-containing protein [Parabacteroides sp. PF5-6]
MTKKLHLIFTLFLLVGLSMNILPGKAEGEQQEQKIIPSAAGIIFVKEDGNGNGSSWEDATGSLSDALIFTNTNTNEEYTIQVAAGTYYPESTEGLEPYEEEEFEERDRTFLITSNVTLLGGYDPDGSGKRDLSLYETVLNGELDEGNVYHVVVMVLKTVDKKALLATQTATLDGFTIINGNSDQQDSAVEVNDEIVPRECGGGVWVKGKVVLTHNTISTNKALLGAGVWAEENTILTDNIITLNESIGSGGGVYALTSVSLIGNTITSNQAGSGGGGVMAEKALLVNNIISDNTANSEGGGVNASNATILVNNTITGNTAKVGDGGGVYATGSTSIFNNILWGNTDDKNLYTLSKKVSVEYNLIGGTPILPQDYPLNLTGNIDPLFVNATNGDFSLSETSPAINAGSNALYEALNDLDLSVEFDLDTDLDLAGNPRFKGSAIDIGAYEYQSADNVTYHNLTLEVAPGIELYNLTAGEYQIEDGSHLFLQFLPEDRTLTADDVLLLIDGVETEFKDFGEYYYFSYILNPITQQHSVVIALREYTVTLPEVQGITYDVGAGMHRVAYGNSFTFRLTLADGIDPADVHVYANGQEIRANKLRSTVLTYTIDRVITAVTVLIKGGSTTSNASLTHGVRLAIDNGQLTIDNEMANAVDVAIYTITGQNMVQLRGLRGSRTLTLPAGIYIVRAGQQSWKVIING